MKRLLSKGLFLLTTCLSLTIYADSSRRIYEVWKNEQAPNQGGDWGIISAGGTPFDKNWEYNSYPIGNGYMGANIFGRVDTERVQLSDKTLHNKGIYGGGGTTGFAELFIDFNHGKVKNYRRSLNINEAIAHVSYEKDGVKYNREYFTSYPDNVMVIKLTSSQKGKLAFTVRHQIPYLGLSALSNKGDAEKSKNYFKGKNARTGQLSAQGNTLKLDGNIPMFNQNYAAEIKIIAQGGEVKAVDKSMVVANADSALILVALGTDYRLSDKLFTNPNHMKTDKSIDPKKVVAELVAKAEAKGYDALKATHLKDYQNLFKRVSVKLNSQKSELPSHLLLANYKKGQEDTYLEELMFQFGRYLLIASSREKTLPANLQGVWSQYHMTPWTGGYWHNINVQMNYWGVMNTNLAECFESYIEYFKAYVPKAKQHADAYVKKLNPSKLAKEGTGENGWIIGTSANAFNISGAGGGHSGPGTGGFTSKLLMEYYYFTQDKKFLEETGYPAMLSMSKFFSKALVPDGDLLLVKPSASPENKVRKKEQVEFIKNLPGHPGHVDKKGNYITIGCTFDQGFVWENHMDTLAGAKILSKQSPFLDQIKEEATKLDPIIIGTSGQIKEYREEEAYSDIGDPRHRHISHLCTLYPGTLINSNKPEWMKAAKKTLDLRGNKTTGWAMAHRMNCRARLKQGDEAHEAYKTFIKERTVPNLWTLHPPFQIDGNFGTMAGVAEMLIQSHEAYIEPLPALPKAWINGSYEGLVARGNFVFSAKWKEGKISYLTVTSRMGGVCRIKYTGIDGVTLKDSKDNIIKTTSNEQGHVAFSTRKGESYTFNIKSM
ncbi:glycoside hydrolase family 95 protein [Lentisphaera profundi]|uniref:Glycoside hydrolase family 95 protein n=1 Tax=Lentisphaera profundi TaxID=1658616 RepID=A0ABY7VZ32_9BACT|nr:glycoside hydrolase family 95 protein [Lentisphaera profundi]WDE98470.1 glycoside hydrolase family 95 protein [Lentisphaera profundi]